jgi:sulfhydrogenase subunit delta
LNNRKPNISPSSVCTECKLRGTTCVMVAYGMPCLGPVTHSGCDALCPSYNRGCFGCYGPKETPNTKSLAEWWSKLGVSELDIMRGFRSFNANADAFRKESEAHEK